MHNKYLHPLKTNEVTGEPFLRARTHANIILTPPRWDDAPMFHSIMSDEQVHKWLKDTPVPYLPEHANAWLKSIKIITDNQLNTLNTAEIDGPRWANTNPVRIIREVNADGTDTLIGDIYFFRCLHGELMSTDSINWAQQERNLEVNYSREVGDRDIIWSLGYILAPSHHGRGIMTDVLNTILHEWAIPRMNVHQILVTTFTGNEGSLKVFLKNGFRLRRTLKNEYDVRGRKRDVDVLEWQLI